MYVNVKEIQDDLQLYLQICCLPSFLFKRLWWKVAKEQTLNKESYLTSSVCDLISNTEEFNRNLSLAKPCLTSSIPSMPSISPVRYVWKAFEFYKWPVLLEIRQIFLLRKRGGKWGLGKQFWIHCDIWLPRCIRFFWYTYEMLGKKNLKWGRYPFTTYVLDCPFTHPLQAYCRAFTHKNNRSLHTYTKSPSRKSHTGSHRLHPTQKMESLHLSSEKAP